jgi:hypothetical protein
MQVNSLPYYSYKSGMPNLTLARSPIFFRSNIENSCCVPASVANVFLYLASRNRSALALPVDSEGEKVAKYRLVEKLAKYMGTSKIGTDVEGLITGISRHTYESGYRSHIEWQGIHHIGRPKAGYRPDPEWIMENSLGENNCILWIGSYKYNPNTDTYRRKTGHAVTVAGFSSSFNEFLVHDPASSDIPETYEIEEIRSGRILFPERSIPTKGLYKIREADPYVYDGELVKIIEGAVAFEVESRKKPSSFYL